MASSELETTSFTVVRSRTLHERVNVVAGLFAGQTSMREAEIACKPLTDTRYVTKLGRINGSDGREEQVDTRKALELLRG